jgi:hypothetical protein
LTGKKAVFALQSTPIKTLYLPSGQQRSYTQLGELPSSARSGHLRKVMLAVGRHPRPSIT